MYSPSELDVRMIEAAAAGDTEKLREIKGRIGDDAEFKRRCEIVNDCEGRRVLHFAAGMGVTEMCEFLIEEVNVDVNIQTERGDTPLLHAVKEGHVNTAKYLIDHDAEIAMSDSKGCTSFHYAAQRDNKELMLLLLMKGANIEAKSVDGTPLQCAALSGNVDTVRFLLERGAEPNSICTLSGSPLICAIKSHSFECMELLLKAGAESNTSLHGLGPLALAASEGQTKFLKPLLEAGANPDSFSPDNLSPIEHAALKCNVECVRILFPVSRRIPNYPNWSIDGIMDYFQSEEAKTMREEQRNVYLDSVISQGKTAWKKKDYSSAMRWYSEAIYLDPSDGKLFSNRSLCWARLGEATFALRDAEECVRLRPDWAKAHFIEGSAWELLQNYRMSSVAYKRASILAPENDEIMNAFRNATGKLAVGMIGGDFWRH
ncbi:hypothetical protein ACS0TY_007413 [Phlomoides rotata]